MIAAVDLVASNAIHKCCAFAESGVLQPVREHLGDIIAWFSAMAPADPTARLVVCQATKNDKAWLQA
jgi:hypothetical protein